MIKQNPNVKVTTRFSSGKMLMFAKVSIKSFVYDLIDVLMFPDEKTQTIYEKYMVKKCYLYQNLTDTDSTSIFFLFICHLNSIVDEITARNIIFEVMINSKILNRLDLSDDFCNQFSVQNKKLKKQVGLFEVENINRANIITIALNPKEYLEEFDDFTNNKKHKGLTKSTPGMDFDAYYGRLTTLGEYFNKHIKETKKIEQKRFQVINDSMQMRTVNKIQFSQLNDKRFYSANRILSLPYGHFVLDEIRKEKHKYRKIHEVIQEKKWDFLKQEATAVNKTERIKNFSKIFIETPKLYLLNSDTESEHKIDRPTKEYFKSGVWQ